MGGARVYSALADKTDFSDPTNLPHIPHRHSTYRAILP